jgi:hypothetical protein
MLAFASQSVPLLIYTTLSPKASKSMFKLRDSLLSITSSLQLLQPYLTSRSQKPLELDILVACLTSSVLAFSDLERCLNGARVIGRHALLRVGVLGKWRLRSIGATLGRLGVAFGLIIEVMHWYAALIFGGLARIAEFFQVNPKK